MVTHTESSSEPSDEEVLDAWPSLPIDEDNVDHFRGRLRRQLLINRCDSCGLWHHPPQGVCPRCWSGEVVPTEVSGRGTVELTTDLHVGTPHSDIDYTVGHRLVAVRLDDAPDVRFTASVRPARVDRPWQGTRVALDWGTRDGAPVPIFIVSDQQTGSPS